MGPSDSLPDTEQIDPEAAASQEKTRPHPRALPDLGICAGRQGRDAAQPPPMRIDQPRETAPEVQSTSAGPDAESWPRGLADVRSRLVGLILRWELLMISIGTPISLSRIPAIGWQPAMGLHLLIAAAVGTTFLYRRRLPPSLLAALVLGLPGLVAAVGLLNFGLVGNGMVWSSLTIFIAATLYPVRVAVALFGVILLMMLVLAHGQITGWAPLPFDVDAYVNSWSGWSLAIVASALAALLLIAPLGALLAEIERLLERVRLQNLRIEYLANHDALTGLPSRRVVGVQVEQAVDDARQLGRRMALLFLDLDLFKQINDTHGHDAGDTVLKTVATRTCSVLGSAGRMYRIGGDEFVVLLPVVDDADHMHAVCEQLVAAVIEPIPLDDQGTQVRVGVSIGAALYPDEADKVPELRKLADQRMYAVKRSGLSGYDAISQASPPD